MIRFPDMKYYNIHTHVKDSSPENIFIFNQVVRTGWEGDPDILYQSIGIHPWYIENEDEQFRILEKEITGKRMVALGEAGLDKMAKTPLNRQREIFLQQALLAEKVQKPVIIHCVKAWDELIALKKEIKPSVAWIVHGFRGKPEQARQLVQHGFWLSFGTYFNPDSLQKAWPERCLAETDEENLSIREVYQQFADSLHIPMELLTTQLRKNVQQVFSI